MPTKAENTVRAPILAHYIVILALCSRAVSSTLPPAAMATRRLPALLTHPTLPDAAACQAVGFKLRAKNDKTSGKAAVLRRKTSETLPLLVFVALQ